MENNKLKQNDIKNNFKTTKVAGIFKRLKRLKRVIQAPLEHARKIINGGFYEEPGKGSRKSMGGYYGEGAERYLERRISKKSWPKEQNTVLNFLSLLPDGLSVLDVPFGTGRFVPFYIDKNFQVYGLEKSPDMISTAKEVLGNQFAHCSIDIGDATMLEYLDASFDLVVSFRFLPHIVTFKQAESALKEFSRVTKKYAILQLGQRERGVYRRRLPKANEKMESWLYPDEIEEMLEEVGFKITNKSGPVKSATTTTAKVAKNVGNWHVFLCEKINSETKIT